MSQAVKPQYSITVLDEQENSFMIKDEETEQIYEGKKVNESEYAFGLFGTIHDEDPEVEHSPVEILEIENSSNVEDVAQELTEKYTGSSIDPLRKRRRNLLDGYRQANTSEILESEKKEETHTHDKIEGIL